MGSEVYDTVEIVMSEFVRVPAWQLAHQGPCSAVLVSPALPNSTLCTLLGTRLTVHLHTTGFPDILVQDTPQWTQLRPDQYGSTAACQAQGVLQFRAGSIEVLEAAGSYVTGCLQVAGPSQGLIPSVLHQVPAQLPACAALVLAAPLRRGWLPSMQWTWQVLHGPPAWQQGLSAVLEGSMVQLPALNESWSGVATFQLNVSDGVRASSSTVSTSIVPASQAADVSIATHAPFKLEQQHQSLNLQVSPTLHACQLAHVTGPSVSSVTWSLHGIDGSITAAPSTAARFADGHLLLSSAVAAQLQAVSALVLAQTPGLANFSMLTHTWPVQPYEQLRVAIAGGQWLEVHPTQLQLQAHVHAIGNVSSASIAWQCGIWQGSAGQLLLSRAWPLPDEPTLWSSSCGLTLPSAPLLDLTSTQLVPGAYKFTVQVTVRMRDGLRTHSAWVIVRLTGAALPFATTSWPHWADLPRNDRPSIAWPVTAVRACALRVLILTHGQRSWVEVDYAQIPTGETYHVVLPTASLVPGTLVRLTSQIQAQESHVTLLQPATPELPIVRVSACLSAGSESFHMGDFVMERSDVPSLTGTLHAAQHSMPVAWAELAPRAVPLPAALASWDLATFQVGWHQVQLDTQCAWPTGTVFAGYASDVSALAGVVASAPSPAAAAQAAAAIAATSLWTRCDLLDCGAEHGCDAEAGQCTCRAGYSGPRNTSCATPPEPVPAQLLEWSSWFPCNRACGGGQQFRVRDCQPGLYGGAHCPGPDQLTEWRACNTQVCAPADNTPGSFTPWVPVTACNATCNGLGPEQVPGARLWRRVCANPAPSGAGADCDGASQRWLACDATYSCVAAHSACPGQRIIPYGPFSSLISADCSGHGQCAVDIGQCTCLPGWAGDSCSIEATAAKRAALLWRGMPALYRAVASTAVLPSLALGLRLPVLADQSNASLATAATELSASEMAARTVVAAAMTVGWPALRAWRPNGASLEDTWAEHAEFALAGLATLALMKHCGPVALSPQAHVFSGTCTVSAALWVPAPLPAHVMVWAVGSEHAQQAMWVRAHMAFTDSTSVPVCAVGQMSGLASGGSGLTASCSVAMPSSGAVQVLSLGNRSTDHNATEAAHVQLTRSRFIGTFAFDSAAGNTAGLLLAAAWSLALCYTMALLAKRQRSPALQSEQFLAYVQRAETQAARAERTEPSAKRRACCACQRARMFAASSARSSQVAIMLIQAHASAISQVRAPGFKCTARRGSGLAQVVQVMAAGPTLCSALAIAVAIEHIGSDIGIDMPMAALACAAGACFTHRALTWIAQRALDLPHTGRQLRGSQCQAEPEHTSAMLNLYWGASAEVDGTSNTAADMGDEGAKLAGQRIAEWAQSVPSYYAGYELDYADLYAGPVPAALDAVYYSHAGASDQPTPLTPKVMVAQALQVVSAHVWAVTLTFWSLIACWSSPVALGLGLVCIMCAWLAWCLETRWPCAPTSAHTSKTPAAPQYSTRRLHALLIALQAATGISACWFSSPLGIVMLLLVSAACWTHVARWHPHIVATLQMRATAQGKPRPVELRAASWASTVIQRAWRVWQARRSDARAATWLAWRHRVAGCSGVFVLAVCVPLAWAGTCLWTVLVLSAHFHQRDVATVALVLAGAAIIGITVLHYAVALVGSLKAQMVEHPWPLAADVPEAVVTASEAAPVAQPQRNESTVELLRKQRSGSADRSASTGDSSSSVSGSCRSWGSADADAFDLRAR